jgi:hypothetical protein
VPVLCAERKWLWNAGRWARVSTKVNGERELQTSAGYGWSRADLLLARQSAALLPSCARPTVSVSFSVVIKTSQNFVAKTWQNLLCCKRTQEKARRCAWWTGEAKKATFPFLGKRHNFHNMSLHLLNTQSMNKNDSISMWKEIVGCGVLI